MTLNPSVRPQITTRLLESEHKDFRAYAESFGLDPASLLILLLAREARVGRLPTLLEADLPRTGPRRSTVTIHKKEPGLHERVAALAKANDVSVSRVCAALILAELRERWLKKVITTRFESL